MSPLSPDRPLGLSSRKPLLRSRLPEILSPICRPPSTHSLTHSLGRVNAWLAHCTMYCRQRLPKPRGDQTTQVH